MDANSCRHPRKLGVEVIDGFPVEWVRLQRSLVLVHLTSAVFIPYGWVIRLRNRPLPIILVLLFIRGTFLSVIFQPVLVLNVDINPRSLAATVAATAAS
jgi:hypothetical protein